MTNILKTLSLLVAICNPVIAQTAMEWIAQNDDYIYTGDPFLSEQSLTFNEFFYDVTGTFSFNFWDGFISGLYEEKASFEKLTEETCLGGRSVKYLQSMVTLTETTTKEVFFLHLAGVLRNLVHLFQDIREDCKLEDVVRDFIKFCKDECEPQKVLMRFSANMSKVGNVYTELLGVLFETSAETLVAEAAKLQKIGEKIGKMVRLAIGFDLFDKHLGKFAHYFEDDDEDFD